MDDLLYLVFVVIFFVLGPIIEQIRRKQQKPPGTRRPLPRERSEPTDLRTGEQPTRPQTERPRPSLEQERESETAATMVPEDLWAVLTGQPMPQRAPQRAPQPPPEIDFEDVEAERRIPREDVTVDERRRPVEEAVSLEVGPRRMPMTVVSLEDNIPDTKTRHAAFHDRIQQKAPAQKHALAPQAALLLKNPADLRRAILIQAILGTPKGLE